MIRALRTYPAADLVTVCAALGHGLGLAIAKAIVEVHDGHIGVSSTLGEESCLYFTVPAAGNRELAFPVDRVRIA